jgi:hypothetical protein
MARRSSGSNNSPPAKPKGLGLPSASHQVNGVTLLNELVQSVRAVRNVLGDGKRYSMKPCATKRSRTSANTLAIALRLRDGSRCKPF